MKILVWGLGEVCQNIIHLLGIYPNLDILAFTCNDSARWNQKWKGKEVISPSAALKLDWDKIYILAGEKATVEIKNQLLNTFGVSKENIMSRDDLYREISNKIVRKYVQNSNKEIRQVVQAYRNGLFSVYGSYLPKREQKWRVHYDSDNDPYIIFEEKRMYFPQNYKFATESDGSKFIWDILKEQDSNSPHLYLKNQDEIPNQAIIVDAGVCEGNFALRYVEKAKKLYLIEPDPNWQTALRKTFAPYKDKVVFCNKFLSGRDNDHEITLDHLIDKDETVDFLKMDIEGAEVEALLGAKEILERSNARCSICSDHRQYDEKYISFLLKQYGYEISVAKGYMCFIYDKKIVHNMELRRGIVYGKKKC